MKTAGTTLPGPDRSAPDEGKGQGTAPQQPTTRKEKTAREEEMAAVLSFFLG